MYRRLQIRFVDIEQLEIRRCLAAVSFVESDIDCCSADGASSIYAADLDGDGDLDVLSASRYDGMIAWYKNTDGDGNFGDQQVVNAMADDGAQSVFAADLDGDGDNDVLSAMGVKLAWYENTDGAGHFGDQQLINTVAGYIWSVFVADLDGDGDNDVLSASGYSSGQIIWYENTDGTGHFGDQHVIHPGAAGALSAYPADLDGDGDVDVLSTSSVDGIAWYENTDGAGQFSEPQLITTAVIGAWSVHSADLDGDGDVDVLSASLDDDKIAWYQNTDGKGQFGPQQVITTTAGGARSVYLADVDGDSDFDVLSASFEDDKIAWYENVDGAGHFSDPQVITTVADGAISVLAADLDGDSDLDVLSASFEIDKIAWYENRPIGDSNDDGVFNSSDLVMVFQTDKYEDNVSGNASFDEGDWNQDGDFDSRDFVFAFQAGNYVAAAASLEIQIAAAVEIIFAADDGDAKKPLAFVA